MQLHEISNEQFRQLLENFLDFLKEKSYKGDVLDIYQRTLSKINLYMYENGINEYKPEVGVSYYEQYVVNHQIGKSRSSSILTNIRRLNDFYLGKEFKIKCRGCNVIALPDSFESVLKAYEQKCFKNRNKDNTIFSKCQNTRRFLAFCVELGCQNINDLSAAYITKACLMVTNKDGWAVIRSFLKFLCQEGWLSVDFSTIVPKYKKGFTLPTTYTEEEINHVEAVIDRSTAIGKRNYAMILLATRLGMRSGDIILLCIENIDFYRQNINFSQQKTGEPMQLPLLPEIALALKDYLQNGRPKTNERRIFLRTTAPFQAITTSVLRFETAKYFDAAGINIKNKKHGPHTFRSSLATSMVNDNVPYESIRKILGHADPDAIKHYAKLDVERLRLCAIEVPAPTGIFKEFLEGGCCI